jgi:MFS family permease
MVVRRRGAAFGLLGAMQVLLIAAITLPLLGLPAVQREFGLAAADLALLTAVYGLSFGGLLLLGGRFADLYGGRTVFLAGLLVFGAGSAVGSGSASYPLVLGARFVQGAGAALVAPAAMVLLGTVFPEPARHRRALATWGVLSGLGATAGNVASGPIVAWTSWRLAFALPAVLAVAAILAGLRLFTRTTGRSGGARLDVVGAVLATGGMTALSFGLLQSAVVPVVAGAAGLVAFFLVEGRVRGPLLPPRFLVSRRRSPGLVAIMVTAAAMGTMWFLLSLYLQQVRGLSALETTSLFLPYAVAQLVTGMTVPAIVGRFGPRVSAAAGLAVAGAGLGLLSRLGADSSYAVVLGGLLVFVVGATVSFSGAMVAATSGVPDRESGLAGGVANTAMEAGPTVGFALLVSAAGNRAAALSGDGAGVAEATSGGYAFAFGLAAGALLFTAALVAVVMSTSITRKELSDECTVH